MPPWKINERREIQRGIDVRLGEVVFWDDSAWICVPRRLFFFAQFLGVARIVSCVLWGESR